MKRTVQILMVMAFIVPLVHVANAETMAERKQRIMRKYLRERQKVTQSDMVVPETTQDQRITDSEKFQQFKVDLARKNEAASAPVPVVQQPVPVQARKSWWADDTTDTNTDPYADPFAVKSDDKSKDSKAAWWTQWKARQEEMAKQQESDTSGTYDYSGYDSSGYGYSGQQRDRGGYYGYGAQDSGGYGYGAQDSNDRYGRSYYTGPNNGQLTPNGSSSYDSTPSGMLQLPYPTQTQQDSDNPRTPSSSYTPYKSRYGTQQQNQQQAAPNQQQNFNRPTPYEQWKKENKSWDPAADDAYLDALMKKNREK